ncbi:MAG: DUF3460 family protein [Betaproteobacteria bacterium]|jgi:hypothetical protein
MAAYISKITEFLTELKKKNPEIERGQMEGRALLWDKSPTTVNEQKTEKLAKIPQKSYVYSND